MTEVQRAAIARAELAMRPAMELYEHRNRISYHVGLLDLETLKRLRRVLDALTGQDLEMLLENAEGLAEWNAPAEESPDAASSHQGASASAAGSGTGR